MSPNHDDTLDPDQLLAQLGWVKALAHRLVVDPNVADDVLQQVCLLALEKQPRDVSGEAGLRRWLSTVTRRLVEHSFRSQSRRVRREHAAAVPEALPSTADIATRREMLGSLVEAVTGLGEPHFSVLVLRYFDGLTVADIAARDGISDDLVRTRLSRARRQLHARLERGIGPDRDRWLAALSPIAVPAALSHGTTHVALVKHVGGVAVAQTSSVLGLKAIIGFALVVLLAVTAWNALDDSTSTGAPGEVAVVAPLPGGVERGGAASAVEHVNAVPLKLSADASPVGVSAVAGTNVLRVTLEGVIGEDARAARITLTGVDARREWPEEIRDSWASQGLTSEFDLDPFFARVAQRDAGLRIDELEVEVDHPQRFLMTTRIPMSRGAEQPSGQFVYEATLRLIRPEFWPEFTLAVRDADTRAHLEGVELHFAPGVSNAAWGLNSTSILLGGGLTSPIPLIGGRDASEPEAAVAGMAISPASGEPPRLIEFASHFHRFGPERGVIVSARAPGYAWNSTSLDVSKGGRELLLERAATLNVQLTNVQLERYAALATQPMLCVYWIRPDGGNQYVHFAELDETLASGGLRLKSLTPGGYRVAVELGGGTWSERPVLARSELSLTGGEMRETVLALDDPPALPERATLAGVVSFPANGLEEKVRLQLYFQPTQRWHNPDVEFSLSDLQRVGGTLPTWSFRVEDLPIGRYRVQLLPFLKVVMIDLPSGGREDVKLMLPELAEVFVETVDARTGERILLDDFYYKNTEALPGQEQNDWAKADTEEPGRFRFRVAPGAMSTWPRNQGRLGYGLTWKRLELKPGRQSVRFELEPVYAMRFEFREDGVALPVGDPGMLVMQNIRAVGHEGRVTGDGLQSDMRVEVSAPGVYEISFEGLDAERYHPIQPRFVDVRRGEMPEVTVELRRK